MGKTYVEMAAILVALPLVTASALAVEPTPGHHGDLIPGLHAAQVVAPRGFLDAVALASKSARLATANPSFSRQTKLPCSACHYQFPRLTPFGRLFKLNGYTLTGLTPITEPTDTTAGREFLKLAPFPPVSAMVIASLTHTGAAQPGTQNNTTSFPQQASVFFSGEITPNLGAFTQFTYTDADGKISIDNVDIRYARHATLGDRDMIWGVTIHNNPTVQDVWNSTPAWGYPFVASEVSPGPIASTLIDGGLAQSVLGLGAYTLLDNTVYAEATMYRSAPQGSTMPLDSTSTNTTNGVIPYWRLALQHQGPSTYLMLGTYGLAANLYPQEVSGTTNRYTDIGVDAQIEHTMGGKTLIGHATYIHEQQHLDAFRAEVPAASEGLQPTLSTFRANVDFLPNLRYGFTVGYFQTMGTSDTLLYAPGALSGSRTGSPNTQGEMGEITYNAWENTRFGLQYMLYNKFNGATSAYDVVGGRRASDNNTLYLYTWLAF